MKDRTVNLQIVSLGRRPVENLGPKTWTGRIDRIAAGHAEGYRSVAGYGPHQVDAPIIGAASRIKIAIPQTGAGMIDRMDFQAQTFLQPGLQLGVVGMDRVGQDAERCATVNLFQTLQNGP